MTALQTSHPNAGRRWLIGLVPAALLIVVSVWEIIAAVTAGSHVPAPDSDDWQRAQAAVRDRHAAGDLIAFAPPWIDPVGRMHLGDLIPIELASRMDDARYGVVWEVSIDGAEAPEARGRQVAWSAWFGGVRVRKLVREPAVVVTDFSAEFGRAAIRGPAVGRPQVKLEEVGFLPRTCIRVEPRPDKTVRISYRDVALGTSLVGYVGLADVFTRRDVRDPGRLVVSVDGAVVAEREFGVDSGWVRFSADTAPSERAVVEFAATALGPRARKRLICFAAEARR